MNLRVKSEYIYIEKKMIIYAVVMIVCIMVRGKHEDVILLCLLFLGGLIWGGSYLVTQGQDSAF